MVPPTTDPGGKPMTAEPGETPRSPLTMLGPVLVTVVPPRTAKLSAVPRNCADACDCTAKAASIATRIGFKHFISHFLCFDMDRGLQELRQGAA